MRVINIIAAGGTGSRFGADIPKQFCLLAGVPVLHHAARRLAEALPDAATVVVIDPAWASMAPAGAIIASPGETRWQSVRNALDACVRIPADIILVHDGARPLPHKDMILRVADACRTHQGAIPVVPVTDSLRRTDGTPVNRADFRAVQTPQAFRADLLRRAYALPERPDFTDDASVMTAAGFSDIALVPGHPHNLKITLPLDLQIAALYLTQPHEPPNKSAIKQNILDLLKQENAFWSYAPGSVTADNIGDDRLIAMTLRYLDLKEIDMLFEIYSYKKVKDAWRKLLVPEGDYLYTLNRFLAWYYFKAKNPRAYLRSLETRHLNSLMPK